MQRTNGARTSSAELCKKLSSKRIYFGHQSVGFSIIEGLNDILSDNPQCSLKIAKTVTPQDFTQPLFAHSTIGNNSDPKSKYDAFATLLNQGIGNSVDIALLKLCYLDINDSTDVSDVFTHYTKMASLVKQRFPNLIVVHTTVPLTTLQTGMKAVIKKILGKPIVGYVSNVKRHEYNEMIRSEFGEKDPIFDIAEIESTFPDGSRAVYYYSDGKAYHQLVPAYTKDGGHLNESGRKVVAERFLIFLANL